MLIGRVTSDIFPFQVRAVDTWGVRTDEARVKNMQMICLIMLVLSDCGLSVCCTQAYDGSV